MYAASSLARNTATVAMSSGLPMRRIGIIFLIRSPALLRTAALMSVSMKPGAMALTVTPRLANSTARARVKELIAPLLAA